MDHLLNDASPDDAAEEVGIKNEVTNSSETCIAASQTLPYLLTQPVVNAVVHPDSSAASFGLHILSVSAAAPSMLMSDPKPLPRLPPISLLTAAAATLQPMQCRTRQTSASVPSPPQPHRLHSRMIPLQPAVHSSSSSSLFAAATLQSSDHLQADDILCRYRNKKCGFLRAIKRNGEHHNLCERHRAKANQNQRKLESKRRVKKRMMQCVATRAGSAKRVETSPTNSATQFAMHGSYLA